MTVVVEAKYRWSKTTGAIFLISTAEMASLNDPLQTNIPLGRLQTYPQGEPLRKWGQVLKSEQTRMKSSF